MLSTVRSILVVFGLLLWGKVFSKVEFLDHATPELISSTDNLGMGNANFGEDFGPLSVFHNPASKLGVRKHKIGLFNFNGEFNGDTFSRTFGDNGLSFKSFQQGVDFLSQRTMRDKLVDNDGGLLHQRMGVASFYQFKRFTIGHFSSHFSTGALVDEDSTYYGNRREDHGPYINFTTLLSRKLLFGLTYVYLTRSETQGMIDAAGISDIETRTGRTNHLILGFKYQISRKLIGSLVARDALNSDYFDASSSGTPRNNQQTIDLALTSFMSRNRVVLNIALRDITSRIEGIDTARKIQLGLEYKKTYKSGFRFGYLDRGLTLGWFYKTKKVGKFSVSTYSADTTITGVKDQDRRLTFQYSL